MTIPATLVLLWAATLAAFVALAIASAHTAPLPGDAPATDALQHIATYPATEVALDQAAVAGGQRGLAIIALALGAALLARGMRLEAAALAGAFAMRLLQLALRGGIDWTHSTATADAAFIVPGGGFPSGHVVGQVLVFGLLFAWAPRIFGAPQISHLVRVACIVLITLGAFERVAVGAHWPSEALGAALLAALYLLPAVALSSRVQSLQVTDLECSVAPRPRQQTTAAKASQA